jgi:hypothetical protein
LRFTVRFSQATACLLCSLYIRQFNDLNAVKNAMQIWERAPLPLWPDHHLSDVIGPAFQGLEVMMAIYFVNGGLLAKPSTRIKIKN